MQIVPKIDIHVHCNPFPQYGLTNRVGRRWISPEDLIARYDKLHVQLGVLQAIAAPEDHYDQLCSFTVQYTADKYPDRFIWFAGLDPRAVDNASTSDLTDILRQYRALGAKGVGELTANLWADDPLIDNLFYYCGEEDMPITIHVSPKRYGFYGLADDIGLPRLEKMLKRYPKTKIFGHSQLFWAEMSGEVDAITRTDYPKGPITKEGRISKIMRACPNLYCDVSARSGMNAFTRDPKYTYRFIEEFSDRIMWGTDYCEPDVTYPFEFDEFLTSSVERGDISFENYYKIVRGNAERLLHLS